MLAKIRAFLTSAGFLKFLRDAFEAAAATFVALNLAFPASFTDAKAEAVIAATAVGAAVIAVARRELWPLIKAALFGTA